MPGAVTATPPAVAPATGEATEVNSNVHGVAELAILGRMRPEM